MLSGNILIVTGQIPGEDTLIYVRERLKKNLILAKVTSESMNVKDFKKHTFKTHRSIILFQDKCCLFKFYDRLLNSIRSISARVHTVIEYCVKRDLKDHLIRLFLERAWSRMAQHPVQTNF